MYIHSKKMDQDLVNQDNKHYLLRFLNFLQKYNELANSAYFPPKKESTIVLSNYITFFSYYLLFALVAIKPIKLTFWFKVKYLSASSKSVDFVDFLLITKTNPSITWANNTASLDDFVGATFTKIKSYFSFNSSNNFEILSLPEIESVYSTSFPDVIKSKFWPVETMHSSTFASSRIISERPFSFGKAKYKCNDAPLLSASITRTFLPIEAKEFAIFNNAVDFPSLWFTEINPITFDFFL